jgi:hypothetical protein
MPSLSLVDGQWGPCLDDQPLSRTVLVTPCEASMTRQNLQESSLRISICLGFQTLVTIQRPLAGFNSRTFSFFSVEPPPMRLQANWQ